MGTTETQDKDKFIFEDWFLDFKLSGLILLRPIE
jgi:hypothetical protein